MKKILAYIITQIEFLCLSFKFILDTKIQNIYYVYVRQKKIILDFVTLFWHRYLIYLE